jgi:hypothetical protein
MEHAQKSKHQGDWCGIHMGQQGTSPKVSECAIDQATHNRWPNATRQWRRSKLAHARHCIHSIFAPTAAMVGKETKRPTQDRLLFIVLQVAAVIAPPQPSPQRHSEQRFVIPSCSSCSWWLASRPFRAPPAPAAPFPGLRPSLRHCGPLGRIHQPSRRVVPASRRRGKRGEHVKSGESGKKWFRLLAGDLSGEHVMSGESGKKWFRRLAGEVRGESM